MELELSNPVEPFSTVPLGAAMVRMALGSSLCANAVQDETPAVRSLYHVTVDSNADIAQCVTGVEDINFWPIAIAKVYKQASHVLTGMSKTLGLNQEWINADTVYFHLKDNLPQSIDEVEDGKVLELQQVMLAFTFDGQTHWCSCGGNMMFADPVEIITGYGNITGTGIIPGLLEQYEVILSKLPAITTDMTDHDLMAASLRRWIVLNALIFNYNFTVRSQQ